ncbi:hypothetical protein Vadar_026036 [Vaccinium darrowii]|uniref:Uncharacterized protein n=1 Tax=Vaccinium darrowii TaxID=229202 RepID=A0ACB7Y2M9_9ERIC|nr:hypothetical protein Vadar_026036 [Vaccinium darrowii]
MLCGRPAVDTQVEEEQHSLVRWAQQSIKENKLDQLIDPSLKGQISAYCLKMFVDVANKCLDIRPKGRPTMADVVVKLEHALAVDEGSRENTQHQNRPKGKVSKVFQRTIEFIAKGADIKWQRTKVYSPNGENIPRNFSSSAASGRNEADLKGQILPTPDLRIFSLSEMKIATKNFRVDRVVGQGGFGKVYEGWLVEKNGSGLVVAVKKLDSESMQGFDEWQSEVCILGRLSHPNLVKLLGYCWEDNELLLVYEFMRKGILESHLFGRGSAIQPLPWAIRLNILIGAARGLDFLHTSEEQVIYRDFKTSNILLDDSYNAKISDFGLAKFGPSGSKTHLTTRVMGTAGYAAPEYVATGNLYVKSDMYGFGVVLVEMLTGLRAIDPNRPRGKRNLIDWVKPYLSQKRKFKHIMDSQLEGKYPTKAASQIAQVALQCLGDDPKSRPSMKEVMEILERIDASNE